MNPTILRLVVLLASVTFAFAYLKFAARDKHGKSEPNAPTKESEKYVAPAPGDLATSSKSARVIITSEDIEPLMKAEEADKSDDPFSPNAPEKPSPVISTVLPPEVLTRSSKSGAGFSRADVKELIEDPQAAKDQKPKDAQQPEAGKQAEK